MLKLRLYLFILLFSTFSMAEKQANFFKTGLQLINAEKYTEAIVVLENSLKQNEIINQAPIFYLIGLANFENENYESALNSLETASDLSKNIKLDKKIDDLIDETIKMQNFIDAGKYKNKISYYLGAGFDSNILNLNKDSFADIDMGGYSALYGVSYSRALIRKPKYQITPEISFADSYSLNSTFKTTSTIQSSDAMQLGLLLPASVNLDLFSKNDLIMPLFGFKALYLPTDSSKRSLAFSSFYFMVKALLNIQSSYIFMPQLTYSIDTSSLTYADPDDNQSAKRILLELNNTFNISEDNHKINFNILDEINTADGKNSSYNKIGALLEARTTVISGYNIGVQAKYQQTDYKLRTTERNDKLNAVGFDVTKNFSNERNLNFNFSRSSKSSNSDINVYQDITFAVTFADSFSF